MQWWSDAGVDILVDEEPRDWLRAKAKAPAEPPTSPAERLPDQLDLFQAYLRDSGSLAYASPSAPRVCPSGNPASGLMIVTDMPAIEDCAAGTLLSGEAGRLFDRMLAAIGRDRDSVYLASLSCLRSPTGGFTGETAGQCATLARHHIGLVEPKAVLLLGDTCGKALLGMAVMQGRGRWHQITTYAGTVPAMISFHPERLLEQPSFKAAAWADLQLLMRELSPRETDR
ncbi:MAG TPA: uracil-DNA glycosylase [Allosphingosinicella sp.]|nr:uracil-DNA glycosylase [Allosphingosinicella sp.]